MELILAGGWLGKEGLYRLPVREVSFCDFEGLKNIVYPSFLILSYDLTPATAGVPVKRTDFPPAVVLKLGEPKPFDVAGAKNCELSFRGFSLSREDYVKAVSKVKGFIERGDVYQINLTSRLSFRLEGSPLDLFISYYLSQPVPYGFYADLGDFFLISGSMELFLRRKGKVILSSPIKGTGAPGDRVSESVKERAENLMITDMMRNDIGRVAIPGTVRVRELFAVKSFRTLSQMYSTVEGETTAPLTEILTATFPPASVTGAPKIRALEIIDELEPHPRGYYCGTAGLVKSEDDFTLSVLIRTAYGGGKEIYYFAGCGIVWDSDPLREWEELILKSKAFAGRELRMLI
jgi:para-aminobenzoate synthetase component 1